MPMLDRGDTRISYEVHGEGPAILLTHGFNDTRGLWELQIEALSASHTLILWDLRGHGKSDSPDAPEAYTEARAVGDVAALLDHTGFDRAVIGGHSLGGFLSLAFALDYPDRVAGLVIANTGPGYKKDDARAKWNDMAQRLADRIEKKAAQATANDRPSRHSDPRGVAMAARHLLTQHSPRVLEGLSAIEAPSLVVVGEDDQQFLAATEMMASRIPDASSLVIPEAGHNVNVDQPAAFDRAVLDFLGANGL